MKVGIDACCWSNGRGFGRFTRELVTHLVEGFPEHAFTLLADVATIRDGAFPDRARLVSVSTREQPTRAATAAGARSAADLMRLSRAAAHLDVDLFFFPAVYSFFPLTKRVATVVTFHDSIAEDHPALVFPGARARLFWTLKCAVARRQADRMLTVSQAARARLAQRFNVAEGVIHVVPEAAGRAFCRLDENASIDTLLARYGLPATSPLLLYVGGLSPHKNLDGLLRSVALITDTPWHLVLVGDYGADGFLACHDDLRALTSSLGLEARVTFTGFVPNNDLVALYNAATLFVMPSLDEGFGLPVVEAMACGTPVVVSARGSLPELVGDAGVLFDPTDETALGTVLRDLLGDARGRDRLRDAGLGRAAGYTWGTAAERTMQLFEEVVRGT